MSRLRASLTYANVTATLALFIALTGGTVYAAERLGSDDIARNAIDSRHVASNALGGKDIAEGTLNGVPVAGYERVEKVYELEPGILFLSAQCPRAKVAVSGGFRVYGPKVEVRMSELSSDRAYTVGLNNPSTNQNTEVTVSVVCVKG